MGVLIAESGQMKFGDKFIRWWRVRLAIAAAPKNLRSVFDIGCGDGYLLDKFKDKSIVRAGCDPRISGNVRSSFLNLQKGYFPEALTDMSMDNKYDAVFALAVFEHFTEEVLNRSSLAISAVLSERGRLIITVPQPLVDRILKILLSIGVVEGQALEEHHGFDPDTLMALLSSHFILEKRVRFQFGLNNLFVFSKKAGKLT